MTDEKKKHPGPEDPQKVGVYICYCGGNISDHVDVEAVRERVAGLPDVSVARTNMFMCSDPGQEMIMEDLKSGAVDRVVVASCAPSLHETTFRGAISRTGANPYIYEHANIREQVSWVHHGEAATDKATRLVAAAAAKASRLDPLEPIRVDAKGHTTVIGGGIAGMRTAIDLADRGIEVALIEKTPFLGGMTAQLERLAPTGESAADLVTGLAARILSHPLITVHTCSTVLAFDGYVGNFSLKVRKEPPPKSSVDHLPLPADGKAGSFIPGAGVYASPPPSAVEEWTIDTGVVTLATGFKPYQPRRDEYGYGAFPEIITLKDLIGIMAGNRDDGHRLKVNGREIRSVAMIHCVGSRQIPGVHPENEGGYLNEYCSRTCCAATLNTANTIRETCPGTRVYEFYRDIRTYGRGQEELYNQAAENGTIFFRFDADSPPEILAGPEGSDYPLQVKVIDTLTFDEEIEVPADLVVLATGMEASDIRDLVEMMKLPVGADRFLLEVHPKLRPVELPQAGILLAGTCQAPMDIGEACNGASSAAVKAASLLARGYVELDPFVAEVKPDKCTGCGACLEACLADGALHLVEQEKDGRKIQLAEVTPAMCMGCGACVAVCPDQAIDINGWTLQQYEAMVDRIVAQ